MAEAEGARALFKHVADRVDERLYGVREPLRLVMVGILTGNHVLIDDVPGVGPSRKKALLKRFGSLARLARAEVDEIASTPGIGPELARAVHERLTGVAPSERRESA